MRDSPKVLGLCLVLLVVDHTWKKVANFDFSFNIAASSYKSGEFFRKHQLQGIANKQTTSEEVIVDVTGEEENEVRSFEDLENNIADSDRGKASEDCAKTTTGTRKRTTTQNQGKKKETKEIFMDSRESRRSAKVLARLQVELLFQRNRFRSRSCLYTEVRKLMARSYASAFGPEKVSAPGRGIKEMGKDEYDKYIKQIEAQQALRKAGYSGIKEKIKTLRGKNIAKR